MKRADHPMRLDVFNQLPATEAADFLRPCVDVDRWIDALKKVRGVLGYGA